MTTKKIAIAFVLTAAALTACGKKGGYQAKQLNHKVVAPVPSEVNDVADETIEVKAEKLLLSDDQLSSSRSSAVAEILKSELLGISAKLTANGDKTAVDISILTDKSENCEGHVSHAQIETKHMITLNKMINFGRVSCVDTSCDHLLVIMEARRKVKTVDAAEGTVMSGAVAVLMKKDGNGIHKPLTTESKNFMQVNSSQVAVETCQEIASRPQTGDEFAIERLRYQQDQRVKAIEKRIAEIDARIAEISANRIQSDEPKALGLEKSKLIQERDSILNARKGTAPKQEEEAEAPPKQEEAVPLDPNSED